MLPNLPIDVDGKQIRVGDRVVFGADNGSTLIVSTVWKITPCFVWMRQSARSGPSSRREFRRVAVLGEREMSYV